MKSLIAVAVLLSLINSYALGEKLVCYYNSKASKREGQGKFELRYLDPALDFCTHLVYGYAAVDPESFNLIPLDNAFDAVHYREVTNLKRQYPGLEVFLSVGGFQDIQGDGDDKNIKYRTLLESVSTRASFVASAKNVLKTNNFDGLDLAWEFPENQPKVIRSTVGGWWHSLKTKVAGESVIDDRADAHREQFTSLVRELKTNFRHDNLKLSVSVLPNVNSSVYYSPRDLAANVDMVIIHAYDFFTPERNPEEADYPAPLYEQIDHKFDENVDYQIRSWLTKSFPANKLVLAIPTYGRSWQLTSDSGISGVPPLEVDGPGEAGDHLGQPGLLSYAEVCDRTANTLNKPFDDEESTHLRIVRDPRARYGTYAFRLPSRHQEGIWVGYEDTDTAGTKATYARTKGLAGVAIVDVTLDDFRGLCAGDKFPILRAAKSRI